MSTTTWSVLLIDDDPEMHLKLTKAFGSILVDIKPVKLTSAMNEQHAKMLLEMDGPFEIVIIGADSSSANSRLELARWLREGQLDSRTQILFALDPSCEFMSHQIQRLGYDGVSSYPRNNLLDELPVTDFVESLQKQEELQERWRNTPVAKLLFQPSLSLITHSDDDSGFERRA